MKKAETFRDVIAWQKAHCWVLAIYRFTKAFPRDELYGLTSQLRRAAVSVPANIVEGFNRQSPLDKARLFNIAEASLNEAIYHLILAQDLAYGRTSELLKAADEIGRLLHSYRTAVLQNS